MTPPYKSDLHLINGPKGGVGKSFVCRTVLQYHLDRQIPCTAFDTDRSNPDLYRCFHKVWPVRLAIFGESTRHEDAANPIFNAALQQRTLVNLPAQVQPALDKWLEHNDILELASEAGIRLVQWHVSNGGYDSLSLFRVSLQRFGTVMPHVFVKNFGMTEDWEPFDDDAELQALLATYSVKVINFPAFVGNKTRNAIDSHSLTFQEALTWADFGAIERQRVRSFLRKSYQAFEDAGVLSVATESKKHQRSTRPSPPSAPSFS